MTQGSEPTTRDFLQVLPTDVSIEEKGQKEWLGSGRYFFNDPHRVVKRNDLHHRPNKPKSTTFKMVDSVDLFFHAYVTKPFAATTHKNHTYHTYISFHQHMCHTLKPTRRRTL